MEGKEGMTVNPQSVAAAEKQHAEMKQAEARRGQILEQILTAKARERLSRIAIVKAERARALEDHLIGLAQQGKMQGKIDEPQLIQFLEQVDAQSGGATKVTFKRRNMGFDDADDDDNDDDLW